MVKRITLYADRIRCSCEEQRREEESWREEKAIPRTGGSQWGGEFYD